MLIFSFLNTALVLLLTFVDGITIAQESFDEYDVDLSSCDDKTLGIFYADTNTGCQTFHTCVTDGQSLKLLLPFACGNKTLFDESLQQCVDSKRVTCQRNAKDDNLDQQNLNRLGRRKPRQAEIDIEDEGREFVPPNENSPLKPATPTKTNFSCLDREMGRYYADVETDCKVFHVCAMGLDSEILNFQFMCLDGKLFDQDTGTCQVEHKVTCMDPSSYKVMTNAPETTTTTNQEDKEGEDETEEIIEEMPKSKKEKTKPMKTRGKTPKPKIPVDSDYDDEEQDASYLKPVIVEVSPGFEVIRSKRQLGEPVGIPCYSYEDMPRTGFSCQGMIPGGYYADPATNCQMYHVCAPGVTPGIMIDFKFLCTNNTVFDQQTRTCMDFEAVDCPSAVSYYGVNTDLLPPPVVPVVPEVTELPPLPVITLAPTIPPTVVPRTVQPTQQGRKFQTTKKAWRVTRPVPASTVIPSIAPIPTVLPPIFPLFPSNIPPVDVVNENGGNIVDNGFSGIIRPPPTVLPPQIPAIISNGQDIPLPVDTSGEIAGTGSEIIPPETIPPQIIPAETIPAEIIPPEIILPPTTKAPKKTQQGKGNKIKNGKTFPKPDGPFGLPIGFMPPDFLPPYFIPPEAEFPFVEPFQPEFFPPQPSKGAKPKQNEGKKIPFQGNQLGFPVPPLLVDPNFESLDYPGDFFPMGFNVPESQKLNPKPIIKPGKKQVPSNSNLPVIPIRDVTYGLDFNPVPAGSEFVEMWIQPSPIYVQGVRVIRQVGPSFVTTHVLPITSFTCRDKITGGYYADTETDCQMFHVCARGNDNEIFDFKFLCTNETVFNQKSQTCEPRTHVACHSSSLLYPVAFANIKKKFQAEAEAKPNLELEDEEVSPVDLVKKKRSHEIEEHLPKTSFTCKRKPIGGYFADVEAECRTFHVCSRSQTGQVFDFQFRCAENTAFNQQSRICDSADQVVCKTVEFDAESVEEFIEVPKQTEQ